MDDANANEENGAAEDAKGRPRPFRPLRVWPACLLAALMLAARFGPELAEDGPAKYWMVAVFGPALCCLLLLIWWLTASRATWRERVFGFAGLVAGAFVVLGMSDASMRGPTVTYFTVPLGLLLFAVTAAALREGRPKIRTTAAVAMAVAGFAGTMFFRNDGMTGDYRFTLRSRWSQSSEEAMLATATSAKANATDAIEKDLANPEWPAFRGTERAGRARSNGISTNWTAAAPKPLWKISVGPGWSSFAVAGRMIFTQDQRGPKETVLCLDGETGREIWRTEFEGRLDDPMGGPGPRATPTLADGAVYAVGGAGGLLRLDAATGKIAWKKELTQVAQSKTPMWGFSSSPLVVGQLVIIYGGGAGEKGLLAFDTATGDLRWSAACAENTYTSPQLNRIAGEESIVMLTAAGLTLLDPASGKTQLQYDWKIPQYRAVQPHAVGEDVVLLPTGMNMGTRALRIKKAEGKLVAEELWTSRHLKPDFVDLVSHDGYAYGNDNGILTCIDLKNGERTWKGGRYGKGQLLLIENLGALLILSEQGKVVLVAADPKEHREIASFQALEGKTWNHPVLVGDRLYVRNAQEAAAFQTARAEIKSIGALQGSTP